MDEVCKFLEYRTEANGKKFDAERAYCNEVEEFIQPMRADICNQRYDLSPAEHCEFYEQAIERDQEAE